MAPREVTTQSGRGSGPRDSGSTSYQVVQRWFSSSGSSYSEKSKTKDSSTPARSSGGGPDR